jgi:membrane-associated phospholipid phosphatase
MRKVYMTMYVRLRLIVAFFVLTPLLGLSQKDTLVKKLDSLSIKSDSLKNGQKNNINSKAYNDSTKLNLHNYFVLLLNDFKQQVKLPFNTKQKDWPKIAEFGAVAAALAFADEPINKFAVGLRNNNKAVASTSNYVTRFGGFYEVYTLAGMAIYGSVFKKEKMKTTTILATQAYLTAGAIQFVFKFLTGRQRPIYNDPRSTETEPSFHGPFFQFKKQNGQKINNAAYSSFPSGHTTAAFAAATVFALEYRNKPLIPVMSYVAATLIGISRLTENKHWPTDVLFGAALGFLSGKQVVNNYHRFSKIRQPSKPGKIISFQLHEFQGRLLPGLTYNL